MIFRCKWHHRAYSPFYLIVVSPRCLCNPASWFHVYLCWRWLISPQSHAVSVPEATQVKRKRYFPVYTQTVTTTADSRVVTMSDLIPSWNIVHKLEKRNLLIAINCVAALSILFFGYDQGMMSGVNNSKDYIDLMGFGYTKEVNGELTPVVTDSLLQGGIVSVYYLGTLCGALIGGWIGDKIGRIRTIASGAVWAILGASLQCAAQNHNWMICCKRPIEPICT